MIPHHNFYSASYKRNDRFYNHPHEKLHGFFFRSLYMFFYGRFFQNRNQKQAAHGWAENYASAPLPSLTVTWIGHSTFLIECDGITLLTDPIFGNASFLFKRIAPPGVSLHNLPSIDYILLSHNHRDHMDEKSLIALRAMHSTIFVPLGDKQWFLKRSFKNVSEYDWWQSTTIMHNNEPIIFTFLPAHHWSQRSLSDRNRSLWGSWMVRYKNYTIYFAGDTAYASHFLKIKEQFPVIDVALMPIGPCEPRIWMKDVHMDAQQAGQAFLDLGAHHFIPMHWGTFPFGIDNFYDPIDQLTAWWQQNVLANSQLHILKFGQRWKLHKQVHGSSVAQKVVEHVV